MARLSDPPSGSSFMSDQLKDYTAQNLRLARSNSAIQTKYALLEKKVSVLINENLQLRQDNMRIGREHELRAKQQYQNLNQIWSKRISDIRDYLGQLDEKIGEIGETLDPLELEDARAGSGQLSHGRLIESPQKAAEEEKISQIGILMSTKNNGRRYALEGESDQVITSNDQIKKISTNRRSSRRESALIDPADLPKFNNSGKENLMHTPLGTDDPIEDQMAPFDLSQMQISDDCIPELDETLDYYPNVTMVSNDAETRTWEQDNDDFTSDGDEDHNIDSHNNDFLSELENERIHTDREAQDPLSNPPASSPHKTKSSKITEMFMNSNLGNNTTSSVSSFKSKSKIAKSKALPSEAEKMPLVGSLSPSKTRSGRRARKEVNYALPSLRTKMRRNQPQMVDAVIDNGNSEDINLSLEDITPIITRKRKSSITNAAKRRKSTDSKVIPPSDALSNVEEDNVGFTQLEDSSSEPMGNNGTRKESSESASESIPKPHKQHIVAPYFSTTTPEVESNAVSERRSTRRKTLVQDQPKHDISEPITTKQASNKEETSAHNQACEPTLETDIISKPDFINGNFGADESRQNTESEPIRQRVQRITNINESIGEELIEKPVKRLTRTNREVRVKKEQEDESTDAVIKEQDNYEGATSLDIASARKRPTRRQSGTYSSLQSHSVNDSSSSIDDEQSSNKHNSAPTLVSRKPKENGASKSHASTRKTIILEQSEILANAAKSTRRKSTGIHRDKVLLQKDAGTITQLETIVGKVIPKEINDDENRTISTDSKTLSKKHSSKKVRNNMSGVSEYIDTESGVEHTPKKTLPKTTKNTSSKSTTLSKRKSSDFSAKSDTPNTSVDVFDFMMDSGEDITADKNSKRPVPPRRRNSVTPYIEKEGVIGNNKKINSAIVSRNATASSKRRKSMIV